MVKNYRCRYLTQTGTYLVIKSVDAKDLRKRGYGDRDLNCKILSMFIFAYTVQS